MTPFIRVKLIISLLVALGFCCFALAQENTPTPLFTPFPTPIEDPFPFPNGLFCPDAEGGLGPTWNGITIGESTFDELQTLMMGLSDNYILTDRGARGFRLSLPLSAIDEAQEKGIPEGVIGCVQDGVIIVLSEVEVATRLPTFFLDDWIAELGTPNAVTWGNSSASRTVFWFGEGLAVSVLVVEPFGASIFHVYFPYQSVEDYETRWPFNRTRRSPLQYHEGGTPPPSEQNPFDFDSIVATITAEPSRTPTATLTPPLRSVASPTDDGGQ
jgi:hypothetical protein